MKWRPIGILRIGLGFLGLGFCLSSLAAQQHCADCLPVTSSSLEPPELKFIQNAAAQIKPAIDWFGADVQHVQKANCARTQPFSTAEINTWLTSYLAKGGPPRSEVIAGIKFENENPRALELFKTLVSPELTFSGKPSFPAKTFNSACAKVECALTEIFGKANGPKLALMLARFGMNGSHLSYEDTSPWKEPELDVVLLTLSDLPSPVLPSKLNKRLTRRQASPSNKDRNVLANAQIDIFDGWAAKPPAMQRYLVFHELAHYLASELDADGGPAWLNAGGWVITDERYHSLLPETFVSKYAQTNILEDFAESFAAYRYNPELLKARSPDKYVFMKDVMFLGVEYTSPAACASGQSPLDRAYTAAAKILAESPQPNPNHLTAALLSCGPTLINLELDNLDGCIRRGVSKAALVDSCPPASCKPEVLAWIKKSHPDFPLAASVIQDIRQKAVEKTQALYLEALMNQDRNMSYYYPSDASPEDFCPKWSAYAYMSARSLNATLGGENLGFAYNYSKPLESHITTLCLTLQSRKSGKRAPITKAEASKALSQFFKEREQ